jgi:hypothetical protein
MSPEDAEALYNLARRLSQRNPAGAKPYQWRFLDLQEKRRITERADTLGNFALAAASARDCEAQRSRRQEVFGILQELKGGRPAR